VHSQTYWTYGNIDGYSKGCSGSFDQRRSGNVSRRVCYNYNLQRVQVCGTSQGAWGASVTKLKDNSPGSMMMTQYIDSSGL
jgi:hypothetical protein